MKDYGARRGGAEAFTLSQTTGLSMTNQEESPIRLSGTPDCFVVSSRQLLGRDRVNIVPQDARQFGNRQILLRGSRGKGDGSPYILLAESGEIGKDLGHRSSFREARKHRAQGHASTLEHCVAAHRLWMPHYPFAVVHFNPCSIASADERFLKGAPLKSGADARVKRR